MRIGVDMGGVVIGGQGTDTSFFSHNYLATPAVQYAQSSLRALNFVHDVYFISKAYPKTAQKTLNWVDDTAIFRKAGIDIDRLVFCQERPQKAAIATLLELDVFIDDREDVCLSMEEAGIHAIRFTGWLSALEQVHKIRKKLRK